MTINGQSISRVASAAGVDRVASNDSDNGNRPSSGSGTSSVEVSDRGRQLAELSELVQGSQDVRSELVDEFKAKIGSGEYQVDFDKLASTLANEL